MTMLPKATERARSESDMRIPIARVPSEPSEAEIVYDMTVLGLLDALDIDLGAS